METSSHLLKYSKQRIRVGVLTFYLSQGLCFATWASRIPDLKSQFNVIDDFWWGMILWLIPIGKFTSIPLSGYTVPKYGSQIMVQVAILGYALSLFLIGISSNIYVLGVCLFLFGAFWNLTDISLNTQGIDIERVFGKTIMGAFHGAWSFAACVGALIGYLMINLQVDTFEHFSIITVLIIISWLFNNKYLVKDLRNPLEKEEKEDIELLKKKKFSMPDNVLIQLGLLGLFALIVESAMFDWGALFFKSTVNVSENLQIGFLIFMVMMTTGRLLTNKAYNIFGKKGTVQLAGILIFIGMAMSSLIPGIVTTTIGFMLVGLGISCMVPTIYSMVGLKSKLPTGIALTILSTISFIGSLIAPPLIGGISKLMDNNIRYAYMVVGIFGLCIMLLATYTNAMTEPKKEKG